MVCNMRNIDLHTTVFYSGTSLIGDTNGAKECFLIGEARFSFTWGGIMCAV